VGGTLFNSRWTKARERELGRAGRDGLHGGAVFAELFDLKIS
jgi:hypothetical protein